MLIPILALFYSAEKAVWCTMMVSILYALTMSIIWYMSARSDHIQQIVYNVVRHKISPPEFQQQPRFENAR